MDGRAAFLLVLAGMALIAVLFTFGPRDTAAGGYRPRTDPPKTPPAKPPKEATEEPDHD